MPGSFQLAYSLATCFAGDALGLISYHTLREVHRQGALARVYAARHRPTEMDPVVRDVLPFPLGWAEERAATALYRLGLFARAHPAHAALLDRVVAARLPRVDVFYGWQGHSLSTLEAARRRGILTLLECCNSHVDQVQELVSEERARIGLGPSERPGWVRRLRREYDAADVLVCPSGYVEESFLSRGFARDRLLVVPYGVDLERFHPGERDRRTFRAVLAGDDLVRKGLRPALAAWRTLSLPDAELVICGHVYPEVQRRVLAGAPASVRLAGSVRDLERELCRAHVLLLPTFEDGFGLVLLEAMASGLPVIATPRSAGPDLIAPGENGFLVPAGSSDGIAAALLRLYQDRDEVEAMGARARATAERFDWSRRSRGIFEHVGARVAAGRSRPPSRSTAAAALDVHRP